MTDKIIEKDQEDQKPLILLEYHRVSTLKQVNDMTIKDQRYAINEFIENNKTKYQVIKVFEDEGKSGFKFNKEDRPAFNEMLELLKNDSLKENPSIYGVMAYDIDRFGRDGYEVIGFGREMQKIQKKICLVNDKIDQTTPFGDFYFSLKAILSQLDGESIKKKLNMGRDRKKRENLKQKLPATHGFGRKKKIIPKIIREKMIKWYKKGDGFKRIQNKIQNVLYPYYNEKEDKWEEIKGFKLSTSTIGERFREWGVEIREPKYSKSKDIIRRKVDQEVNKKLEVVKEEIVARLQNKEEI